MLLEINIIIIIFSVTGIIFNHRNILVLLMSLEMMLLIININYLYISSLFDDLMGQIFTLLILTVAASESALGLAITIYFYVNRSSISIDDKITLRF